MFLCISSTLTYAFYMINQFSQSVNPLRFFKNTCDETEIYFAYDIHVPSTILKHTILSHGVKLTVNTQKSIESLHSTQDPNFHTIS